MLRKKDDKETNTPVWPHFVCAHITLNTSWCSPNLVLLVFSCFLVTRHVTNNGWLLQNDNDVIYQELTKKIRTWFTANYRRERKITVSETKQWQFVPSTYLKTFTYQSRTVHKAGRRWGLVPTRTRVFLFHTLTVLQTEKTSLRPREYPTNPDVFFCRQVDQLVRSWWYCMKIMYFLRLCDNTQFIKHIFLPSSSS